MLSHTSKPVSRFRFIDLDPAVVLVPVAFFFYIKPKRLKKGSHLTKMGQQFKFFKAGEHLKIVRIRKRKMEKRRKGEKEKRKTE